MQKKLIALAVAGLVSGAAFAQTNVTVYGVLDVGYLYSKSDNLKFNGLASGGLNGNRIGFRGTEALGNGLNAVFQAEFGFKGDIQGGLNTTRNAWLGLQHNQFGTFTAGRQNSVAYDWVAKGFASDVTIVHPSNQLQSVFTQLQTSDRVDNSIKYVSPNWGGFTLATVYGFGEKVGEQKTASGTGLATTTQSVWGDTSDAGRWTIGANYNNGPLDLALIYAMVQKDDSIRTTTGAAGDNGTSGWSLGGSYDFKVVKVFAQYQREHNELAAKPKTVMLGAAPAIGAEAAKTATQYGAPQDDTRSLWTVGARVPVGKAGTVIVEYVDLDVDYKAAGVKTGSANGWGLGYEHAFSKRTTGYVGVSRTNYDDFDGKNTAGANVSFKEVLTDKNESVTGFAVGLRHTF